MRTLITGLGSIGQRHLTNIKSIDPSSQIGVWHQHMKLDDAREDHLPIDQTAYTLQEALEFNPDTALICNPSSLHINTALALAEHGIHLFIEKPMSNSLEGIDDLIRLCKKTNLILMVGYNFRFYRPLKIVRRAIQEGQIGRLLMIRAEVGQYLPYWRKGVDYKESVSAKESLGGGVVLELSHELDLVRWIAGEVKAVSAIVDRLSNLEIDVEDTAEIILRFQNGAIGSVHMDMLQYQAKRSCCILGSEGTILLDGQTNRVCMLPASRNEWVDLHPAAPIDRNQMYIDQIRHFFDCVKNNREPAVSGKDGRRIVELSLAVKRASKEQRFVKL